MRIALLISASRLAQSNREFGPVPRGTRAWLNLQTAFDMRVAQIGNAKRIAREISPTAI